MPRLILFVFCIAGLLAGWGLVFAGIVLGAVAFALLLLYAGNLILQMFLGEPHKQPHP